MDSVKSDLDLLELFTQCYKQNEHAHFVLRDLKCLEIQFPASFLPIEFGDCFAGRLQYKAVGFRSMPSRKGNELFYSLSSLERLLDIVDSKQKHRVISILEYWKSFRNSDTNKSRRCYPNVVLDRFDISMERLVNQGIQGLLEDIQYCRLENITEEFHELANYMVQSLDLLKRTCFAYANNARMKADGCELDNEKSRFQKVAAVLESLTDQPPSTTREALQLSLLFAMISGRREMENLPRIIQPFIDRDLTTGIITERECKQIIFSFIDLMNQWIPGAIDEFNDLFSLFPSHKSRLSYSRR